MRNIERNKKSTHFSFYLWQRRKERLAIGGWSCGNNAPSPQGRVVNGLFNNKGMQNMSIPPSPPNTRTFSSLDACETLGKGGRKAGGTHSIGSVDVAAASMRSSMDCSPTSLTRQDRNYLAGDNGGEIEGEPRVGRERRRATDRYRETDRE